MGSPLAIKIKTSEEMKESSKFTTNINPYLSPLFTYKYASREGAWREQLEISPEEHQIIQELIEKARINNLEAKEEGSIEEKIREVERKNSGRMKIIIDTDIGTDIDDVMALICAVKIPSENINLLGVTTCYHPTLLRQKIAKSLLNAAGPPFDQIPVIPGSSYLCGTHRPIYLHGNEGKGMFEIEGEEEMKDLWVPNEGNEAVQFIYNKCKEFPGEVTIVSIGIPTNLGYLGHFYPDFEEIVGHIVVMGGGAIITEQEKELIGKYTNNKSEWSNNNQYDPSNVIFPLPKYKEESPGFHLSTEHNITSDTLASKILFNLECPITIIPLEITSRFWLEGRSIATLLKIGEMSRLEGINHFGENSLHGRLLNQWLSRTEHHTGQCPHDPLALYEAVYPLRGVDEGVFQVGKSALVYLSGTLFVHEWAGFSTFVGDAKGSSRIAVQAIHVGNWLLWLENMLLSGVPQELWVSYYAPLT